MSTEIKEQRLIAMSECPHCKKRSTPKHCEHYRPRITKLGAVVCRCFRCDAERHFEKIRLIGR